MYNNDHNLCQGVLTSAIHLISLHAQVIINFYMAYITPYKKAKQQHIVKKKNN